MLAYFRWNRWPASALICLWVSLMAVTQVLAAPKDDLLKAIKASTSAYNAKKYNQAYIHTNQALAILDKHYNRDNKIAYQLLTRQINIAKLLNKQHLLQGLTRQKISVAERLYGFGDAKTGLAVNALGLLQLKAKQYQKAANTFHRAAAIFSGNLHLNGSDQGVAWANKAYALRIMGKTAAAEIAYRRAVANYIRAWGGTHKKVLSTKNSLSIELEKQHKYADAIAIRRTILKEYDRQKGPASRHAIGQLSFIVIDLQKLNQNAEALKMLEQRRQVFSRVGEVGTPMHIWTLGRLSDFYRFTGNLGRAEGLLKKSSEIVRLKNGALSESYADAAMKMGKFYFNQSRWEEAHRHFQAAKKIRQAKFGADHHKTLAAFLNITAVHRAKGAFRAAEINYIKIIKSYEKKYGVNSTRLSTVLNNFAALYKNMGRYGEAEKNYRRSLALLEKHKKYTSVNVQRSLAITTDNLAEVYILRGDYRQAEILSKKSLNVFQRLLGPSHLSTSIAMNNLASALNAQNRTKEAINLYEKVLKIWQVQLRAGSGRLAVVRDNLGAAYMKVGRLNEALALREKAIDDFVQVFGFYHHETATAYNNLAELYSDLKRYTEAENSYKTAIDIGKKIFADGHPNASITWHNLAWFYHSRKRYAEAEKASYEAVKLLIEGSKRVALSGASESENTQKLLRNKGFVFIDYITIALDLVHTDKSHNARIAHRTFEVSQWAIQTAASSAIAQMAARFSVGNSALARELRELQNLYSVKSKRTRQWKQALSSLNKRQAGGNKADSFYTKIEKLDAKIALAEDRIGKVFPAYKSLVNPAPLQSSEVSDILKEDEALIQFVFSNNKSYAFIVTPRVTRTVGLGINRKQLARVVSKLREGLDINAKPTPAILEQKGAEPLPGDGLPFDLKLSHLLYKKIFSKLERSLADIQHIYWVPSGALQSLPPYVLVSAEPTFRYETYEGYSRVDWLFNKYAFTVMPSVAAFRALKFQEKKGLIARKPFIGFGNPKFAPQKPSSGTRGKVQIANLFRGKLANVRELAKMAPLPETETELKSLRATIASIEASTSLFMRDTENKAVSAIEIDGQFNERQNVNSREQDREPQAETKKVKAGKKDLFLGREATETQVKQQDLKDYRIIAFATHALVAGELKGLAEPALALTPPQKASAKDDGLLTASEVAKLDLAAEWILLSACNTASGKAPGAEGLSGLARAFFYAGGQSLLVSHWPVFSQAAERLTTETFKALKQTGGHRAEALRVSMRKLMQDKTQPENGHPAYWAPFVIVGRSR